MWAFLDKIPYSILIVGALLIILAPFKPMPHVLEKLIMLKNGTLTKPIDIFDLFFDRKKFETFRRIVADEFFPNSKVDGSSEIAKILVSRTSGNFPSLEKVLLDNFRGNFAYHQFTPFVGPAASQIKILTIVFL